ncbi:hypothetical protein HMPREF0493_1274 [Lactobacillus amylolyticus DSM 11664]|uniref:Uncharacterized protein n=1 Tax=Lactobacillus amylolyticus DSM 11664 TaxID=585524 RepID=D4YUR3_9LACO|nr:hypothetical protein HMPREF0493_1274 [Lactobacillus amylolyticus DSM 11664]
MALIIHQFLNKRKKLLEISLMMFAIREKMKTRWFGQGQVTD